MTDKIDTSTLTALNLVLLAIVIAALWGLPGLTMFAIAATAAMLIGIVVLTLAPGDPAEDD